MLENRKRLEELKDRCIKRQMVTYTHFLTPAERYDAEKIFNGSDEYRTFFFGGNEYCERTVLFFIPDIYSDIVPNDIPDISEAIKAVHLKARFASPTHRDYLGSILGLGIERDRTGDIFVYDDGAYVFCLPTVLETIKQLKKVGRAGVLASEINISEVPVKAPDLKIMNFSVMSPRLDAIASGMFGISRAEAVRQIARENITVNYQTAVRNDLPISKGDIISMRGKGKGCILDDEGTSKKGRLYIKAGIYR